MGRTPVQTTFRRCFGYGQACDFLRSLSIPAVARPTRDEPPLRASSDRTPAEHQPERRPIALVIEAPNPDEPSIGAALERGGYTTWLAETGTDARKLLFEARRTRLEPDVLVVDGHLQDVDGLVLCAFLRQITNSPIVLRAAVRGSADRTVAYLIGVDGFVATPSIDEELQALIAGVLRTARCGRVGRPLPPSSSASLIVGNLAICEEQRAASVGTHRLELTRTQYRLLVALAKGAPNVVPGALLGQMVWSAQDECSALVANQIARLRAKLSEAPVRSPSILSIPGVGYRLGPVI